MANPLIPDVKYATLITEGDGAKTDWEINFAGGYISKDHVKAFTEDKVTGQLVIRTPEFVGPNTVRISPAAANGIRLVIYRDTPKTTPIVNYTDGSVMSEANLDKSNQQAVFIAAELADRVVADYDFSNALLYAVETATAAKATADGIDGKATLALTRASAADAKADSVVAVANSALDNSMRFDAIADMLLFVPIRKAYALVAEYEVGFGPGGGGHFTWMPASTAAHDGIVYFRPTSQPAVGRWMRSNYIELNARMAGCAVNGFRNDTVRAQYYLDYCKALNRRAVLPQGTLRVDSLLVKGAMFTFDIYSEGCYIELTSNTPQEAALTLINCVDMSLTGVWRWNGANNPNYRAALSLRAITAEPGAGSQALTRVRIDGHTFRNCARGVSIGARNVDYQCSEITMVNCDWLQTPQPIYLGGSNAGFQCFGNITSEPNAAFPDVEECAILQEGGFVKVIGSLVTNPSARAGIVSRPCSSALYGGSLYGTSNCTGAHTEVNSPLLAVENPLGLINTKSDHAGHMFMGCTGYAGGDRSLDFVSVADVTYAGTIGVLGCNYYRTDSPRLGYNMSGVSPLVRFVTDKTSWGVGMSNWISGIGYGRVVHDDIPVMKVTGVNRVFPANTATPVQFQLKELNNELTFYSALYDTTAGTFFIPPGGFTHLNVVANLLISSAGLTGVDFWLERNGVAVAYGNWANGSANLTATEANLTHGEVLTLWIRPYGASVTISSERSNYIAMTGATR